jgi:hypothetical protein
VAVQAEQIVEEDGRDPGQEPRKEHITGEMFTGNDTREPDDEAKGKADNHEPDREVTASGGEEQQRHHYGVKTHAGMTAGKGVAHRGGIKFQKRLEGGVAIPAVDEKWAGASPVCLEDGIDQEARAEEQGAEDKGGTFPEFVKAVAADTEEEQGEGAEPEEDAEELAVQIEGDPWLAVGRGPQACFAIVVAILNGEIQVAEVEDRNEGKKPEEGRDQEPVLRRSFQLSQ